MENVKEILDIYEINLHTSAIMPFITNEGKVYSKIYEGPNIFICRECPTKIIEWSCIFLGCSYDGKRKATRFLMNYNYKLPVSIDSKNTIYFFPTHSPSSPSCVWVSLHNILENREVEPLKTLITFKNYQQITVDISMHSLNNQILRANSLQNVLTHNHDKIRESFNLYSDKDNNRHSRKKKKDEEEY
ncbi:MAG: competence protein ComK [Bacillus sp. (in: firmicutes)]